MLSVRTVKSVRVSVGPFLSVVFAVLVAGLVVGGGAGSVAVADNVGGACAGLVGAVDEDIANEGAARLERRIRSR